MGIKLSELEEGTPVTLRISVKDKSMPIQAAIQKHVKTNIAYITIVNDSPQRLNFDGVQIDLEYGEDGSVPIIWHNVKVITYKTGYVMQAPFDGTRHNRRSFFRVGVSATAQILSNTKGPRQVTVRDLSLSGFSVTDRKRELQLNIGDELSIFFEDLGHSLNLIGRVTRIEKQEEFTIYGFAICNLCRNLSSYINTKQRQKK